MAQPWEDAAAQMQLSVPPSSNGVVMQPWEEASNPNQPPSFMDKLGNQISARIQQAGDISPTDALPSKILQTWGAGMGTIGDVSGDVVDAAGHAIVSGVNAVDPTLIPNTVNAIKNNQTVQNIASKARDAGSFISDQYNNIVPKGTEARRDLDAAGSVIGGYANALPVAEVGAPIARGAGEVLEGVGDAVYNSGKNAADNARTSFIQELTTPKETASVAQDQFTRSSQQGIMGKRVVDPTGQQQAVMDAVDGLPVKPSNSLNTNYNIIADANAAEAEKLKDLLDNGSYGIIPPNLVKSTFSGLRDQLAENPWLTTAEGSKATDAVINGATKFIDAQPGTPAGMLQARKDFDNWITNIKGEKTFDPNLDTPITAAVRAVRGSMNDMIAAKAPSVAVKDSLDYQSNLYNAMDAIAGKGASEGKNVISRVAQNIVDKLPGKGGTVKDLLALAAATGLGGMGLASPGVATGLAAAYGGQKVLRSPALRKAIGTAIGGTGDVLSATPLPASAGDAVKSMAISGAYNAPGQQYQLPPLTADQIHALPPALADAILRQQTQ